MLIPKRDPPIRIVSSAFFSLGILQRARIELSHFLFSNILKVSNASVLTGVGLTLLLASASTTPSEVAGIPVWRQR
ncbi:hypothetical protein NW807_06255 [Synechococcus sp. R70.1]|uniref:hypothetical protein n=1 Tax=Synechococcus sp. R70.1 TaxID=2964531 RepID=UPI0039C1FE34